jgi:hypothetical protein
VLQAILFQIMLAGDEVNELVDDFASRTPSQRAKLLCAY